MRKSKNVEPFISEKDLPEGPSEEPVIKKERQPISFKSNNQLNRAKKRIEKLKKPNEDINFVQAPVRPNSSFNNKKRVLKAVPKKQMIILNNDTSLGTEAFDTIKTNIEPLSNQHR